MTTSAAMKAIERARKDPQRPEMSAISLRVDSDVLGRLAGYMDRNGPWPRGAKSRLLRTFIADGIMDLEAIEAAAEKQRRRGGKK